MDTDIIRLAPVLRLAAVGRLVAPVAHDVNNPLAAILGRIQLHMARGSAGMSRGPGGLDDIFDQSLVVSDKVQTLGNLARDAVNASAPAPSVLTDHVAEITQLLGRHVARRGLELHLGIPPSTPPVLVRPVDLKLCLAELLLALSAAVRDPTPLHITAEVRGSEVALIVATPGFPPAGAPFPSEAAYLATAVASDGLRFTVGDSFTLSMPIAGSPRSAAGQA